MGRSTEERMVTKISAGVSEPNKVMEQFSIIRYSIKSIPPSTTCGLDLLISVGRCKLVTRISNAFA